MGLGFLKKLFGGGEEDTVERSGASREVNHKKSPASKNRKPTTTPSNHKPKFAPKSALSSARSYLFARPTPAGFLDARQGEDPARLERFGLPRFQTPEELATWLKIPVKTLAWLSDYHGNNASEKALKKQHYHYQWKKKRSGAGYRLIESPKPMLKHVQERILHELLDRVPAHPAAHGFVQGRSILTNALPHAGKYVVLKVDLQNFYPSINIKRVCAIFRGIGYGKETAIWLGRLCSNRIPYGFKGPAEHRNPYTFLIDLQHRHLPQGAPTSPTLANLAAWALDVRLTGLATKFGVTYTRYADDLTFSGDQKLMVGKSLTMLMRYVRGIIKDEGFRWNSVKKKVVRRGDRQTVTGLTVNVKPNIPRQSFDRLKAILTNCVRQGAASQNRGKVENFRAHLEGKIGFVRSINPQKAERLQRIFGRITQW